MQSAQKCCCDFFLQSAHLPSHIFSIDTRTCYALVTSYNRGACFALVTSHNMPIKMLYTPNVFISCIAWTQNMPRHEKVKINRANGQTGGNNRSTTSVLTAFISFGLFNVFRKPSIHYHDMETVLGGLWHFYKSVATSGDLGSA
jgi:hypothetical protein